MKLSAFKNQLQQLHSLTFELPDGNLVPSHFHVTEVGKITKHFIDCGGVERKEEVVNFQLWEANDYNHRLHPEKLINIIKLSEQKLNIGDLPIEIEYQGETIGKYGVELKGNNFILTSTVTACLAEDACGIPEKKPKITISNNQNSCAPGSGCC